MIPNIETDRAGGLRISARADLGCGQATCVSKRTNLYQQRLVAVPCSLHCWSLRCELRIVEGPGRRWLLQLSSGVLVTGCDPQDDRTSISIHPRRGDIAVRRSALSTQNQVVFSSLSQNNCALSIGIRNQAQDDSLMTPSQVVSILSVFPTNFGWPPMSKVEWFCMLIIISQLHKGSLRHVLSDM
jgi:hypothetical protein